jgi:ketosteroid isomerase-like protein
VKDHNELHHFEQFMKQREQAAQAYVSGDVTPLARLLAHNLDASFFGPGGGYVHGAAEVATRYERDVASFDKGSESSFEVLQMAASAGVAYWTGIQHATMNLKGKSEPVPMDLRVTEVFRMEGDGWKLVHRHADGMVKKEEKKK